MNKITAASIYSLVLIAIYFLTASLYQSCGQKKEVDGLTTEEKAVQVADAYSEGSHFEDDGGDFESGSTSAPNEVAESVTSEGSNDPAEVDYTAPARKRSTSPSVAQNGKYVVVAGNYLVQSNAEAMVSKLKKQGFENAETAVFDLSQYYTVIAGRFDNRSYANSVSSELKSIGVDNYVLTKK